MNKLVEDCYVSFINMDHRKDRLLRMKRTLTQVGLPATRTRGMTPAEYQGAPARVAAMRSRPGAIGCHFSQIKVMQDAWSSRKHAFVMEDDLIFCSDFWKRMDLIEAFCSTHPWDVIWLGATFHTNPPFWHKADIGRDAETTDYPRMMRTYGAFATYAYIVNRMSLANVLRLLDEGLERSKAIDWQFIQIEPKLFTYAFVPGCVTQYDNQSDIGKGMTYYSKFARLGPYWFADKMESFYPTRYDWHEAKVK